MTNLHSRLTSHLNLAIRVVQWMELAHRGSEQEVHDFIHDVYGGASGPFIEQAVERIETHGLWTWLNSTDQTNQMRFYNLIMHDNPEDWWNRNHNGPTPEDLGAEPRESHEEHYPEDSSE